MEHIKNSKIVWKFAEYVPKYLNSKKKQQQQHKQQQPRTSNFEPRASIIVNF